MLLFDWDSLFNRCAVMDFVFWRWARADYLFVNTSRTVRLLYDILKITAGCFGKSG